MMTTAWIRPISLAWLLLIPFSGNAVTPTIAASPSGALFLHSDGSVWGTGNVTNYGPGATSPVRLFPGQIAVAIGRIDGGDFALLADGTLWGSGGNGSGQLADGTTQSRSQPVRISVLSGIKAIAAGLSNHVLVLQESGTVLAWGENSFGQLGDGTQSDRYVPAPVAGLTNITRISASDNSSIALKSDGTVWVWGQTCCGAAGNGRDTQGPGDPAIFRLVPTQIQNLDQVIAVTAGDNHFMALRADATVWTWGIGDNGENGTGVFTHQVLPRQILGLDHVAAIDARGNNFSIALKTDGTVWTWGSNSRGRLGVTGIATSAVPIQVPGVSDVVAIAAGAEYNLAMRRDGTMIAWGANGNGQLGDGTLQNRSQILPVLGPGGTGQFNLLQPVPTTFNKLPQGQISLSVASGRAPLTVNATVRNASDADGTIAGFAWKTSDGQQASGPSASFVFTSGGTYNIDVLIRDNAGGVGTARRQVVVAQGAAASVQARPKVGAGPNFSIALANDGRILTWGQKGILGLYDAQAQNDLPDSNSLPLANGIIGAIDFAGDTSAIHVLMYDGTVVGWGANNFGQVGNGGQSSQFNQPQTLSGLPSVQTLAGGRGHRLALTRDGRVFAWGDNSYGQLGLGDGNNRYQPTEVTGLANVVAIAAGGVFSVVLKADGTVWAWGDNSNYQLGDGTTTSRNRPFQIPSLTNIAKIFAAGTSGQVFAQKADGTVWVAGGVPIAISGDPGPKSGPRRVPLFDGAAQIAPAPWHIVVLKSDGTVWTGGKQVSLALGFSGDGDIAGLKQVPGISDVIAVAAGPATSMALRRDGTVLAWGLNIYGQIGDGTLAYQQTPVLVVNATANDFLDLAPEVPNSVPRDKVPPFLLATYASGGLNSTTLYADVRGIISSGTFASAGETGRFASSYNVYVAANVPSSPALPYFQLDANISWSVLSWPMAAFMRGIALDSQDSLVRAQILQNTDLSSPQLAGTSILVGYGTDPDEMLRNSRYRTIFTVPTQ
jgi:alpha-tubulin suppressor-like RCC1 family protein